MYKNIKGLQTGIRAALRRENIEISRKYQQRIITWKRTKGVSIEAKQGRVHIEVVGDAYTYEEIIEKLLSHGIEVEQDNNKNCICYFVNAYEYCETV